MNYIINPYISGPPVSGEDFYGREEDIQKVLNTSHKMILFLATRRMGKTSICRQIKYRCETDPNYSSNLCVSWDLQGKRDTDSAKNRFFSFQNKNALKDVSWNDLKNCSSCNEVIETFCNCYYGPPHPKTIFLLLDEPDILLYFAKQQEYNFLTDLKDAFENIPNLRVVIVSPPRIMNLFLHSEIPCLLDNFQPYFIRGLNKHEAEDLILLSKKQEATKLKFLENGKQLIKDIIEVSNCAPFYIQYLCSNIFDAFPDKTPTQVIENIIEQQIFSPFFTSDFTEIHPIQKIMLLNLANSHEPLESQVLINEVKKVAAVIKEQVPTLKYIDDLISLGILKKYAGNKYHFSNKLFDRWILRDFENLWNQAMEEINMSKKFDKKKLAPGSLKKKDIEEIKIDLEAIRTVLKDLNKKHQDGEIDSELYFKRQLSFVREQGLIIKKLQDHLYTQGANSLCQVLEDIKQANCDESIISQKLKAAEQEGKSKSWSQIVSATANDKSMSKIQAAIETAFKVAEYLVEDNN